MSGNLNPLPIKDGLNVITPPQNYFNYPQIIDPMSIITDWLFRNKVIDLQTLKEYGKKMVLLYLIKLGYEHTSKFVPQLLSMLGKSNYILYLLNFLNLKKVSLIKSSDLIEQNKQVKLSNQTLSNKFNLIDFKKHIGLIFRLYSNRPLHRVACRPSVINSASSKSANFANARRKNWAPSLTSAPSTTRCSTEGPSRSIFSKPRTDKWIAQQKSQ